jgi:hypothetical protein
MDVGPVPVRQQLADLAELKAATQRRAQELRGSPEWVAALEAEERLMSRIQRWARQPNTDSLDTI